jgi:Tfp pilus assembly protein PilV
MRVFRSAAGLTLLEVLLSVFLLAVALIALAGAFPPAYFAVHSGRHFTTAAALDQEVIEGAKRLSFLAVTGANLVALYPASPPAYPAYTRQIQVDDITVGGAVVMKRLTVTTRFLLQGDEKSIPMTTLIAR